MIKKVKEGYRVVSESGRNMGTYQTKEEAQKRLRQIEYFKQKDKHLRGVSAKEQRQYEHIKDSAKKEGRYKGREEEVAARTVMKKHGKERHNKGQ